MSKNVYSKFFWKFSDLTMMTIWIITTTIFIITPFLENNFIRIILGIPMIVFIPGYALISALFIKKDALETAERIVLSIGISIAIVPLLGLILSFTIGIGITSILIILCIYDVILMIISKYRRGKLSENEKYAVTFDKIYDYIKIYIRPRNRIDSILNIILIFAVILAIGSIYTTISTPKNDDKFTEFYILDPNGKAGNYTTNVSMGSQLFTNVYISNHEYKFTNYTVQMILNKNVLISEEMSLDHNEIWEGNMSFAPDKQGNNMKLDFLLFKEKNLTNPYRHVHLTINAI